MGRKLGDAPDLGQAAAAVDVGLEDVHAAALEPLAALVHRRRELRPADARLDALGELPVALQVVVLKRRLGEVQVAVLDARERPERVAPVVPAVAEVDHHRDVAAEQPPALADVVDELAVGREPSEERLHLDRAEAERRAPTRSAAPDRP